MSKTGDNLCSQSLTCEVGQDSGTAGISGMFAASAQLGFQACYKFPVKLCDKGDLDPLGADSLTFVMV